MTGSGVLQSILSFFFWFLPILFWVLGSHIARFLGVLRFFFTTIRKFHWNSKYFADYTLDSNINIEYYFGIIFMCLNYTCIKRRFSGLRFDNWISMDIPSENFHLQLNLTKRPFWAFNRLPIYDDRYGCKSHTIKISHFGQFMMLSLLMQWHRLHSWNSFSLSIFARQEPDISTVL